MSATVAILQRIKQEIREYCDRAPNPYPRTNSDGYGNVEWLDYETKPVLFGIMSSLRELIDQLDLDPAMTHADVIRRRVIDPLQAWNRADVDERDRRQIYEVSRFIDTLLPTLAPVSDRTSRVRIKSGPSRADRINAWLDRTNGIQATVATDTKHERSRMIHREFCKSGTVVTLSYFVNVLKRWDVSHRDGRITWSKRQDSGDKPG